MLASPIITMLIRRTDVVNSLIFIPVRAYTFIYLAYLSSSFFRQLSSELTERNSTKITTSSEVSHIWKCI